MVNANRDDVKPKAETLNGLRPQAGIVADDAEEDKYLIQCIAAQNTQAFDDLFQKYKPRLSRYLAKHLNHSMDIEEACHDIMLVVWNKASQFRPRSKVSTWIFGIARVEVRRIWSRAKPGFDPLSSDVPHELDGNTPEVIFDRNERTTTLNRTLATLPTSLRLPVRLFYFDGCSYAQIAAQTHCSEYTVKNRLQQARRRLRGILIRANCQLPIAG